MKQGELELDRDYINRLENHIKEFELRLSLSDSALDEYKEQVNYLENHLRLVRVVNGKVFLV